VTTGKTAEEILPGGIEVGHHHAVERGIGIGRGFEDVGGEEFSVQRPVFGAELLQCAPAFFDHRCHQRFLRGGRGDQGLAEADHRRDQGSRADRIQERLAGTRVHVAGDHQAHAGDDDQNQQ
jgi:hypothetical protein